MSPGAKYRSHHDIHALDIDYCEVEVIIQENKVACFFHELPQHREVFRAHRVKPALDGHVFLKMTNNEERPQLDIFNRLSRLSRHSRPHPYPPSRQHSTTPWPPSEHLRGASFPNLSPYRKNEPSPPPSPKHRRPQPHNPNPERPQLFQIVSMPAHHSQILSVASQRSL